MKLHSAFWRVLPAAVFLCVGCRTVYYNAWEKLGREKRHLLRSNVEKVQVEQEEAAEEFRDALTQIRELYSFDGGDLETAYRKLKSDFESCTARADDVKSRIDNIERIGDDMLREWRKDLEVMTVPELRRSSEQSLRDTEVRLGALNRALGESEASMDRALERMRSYVLALKHSLNARAVGALKGEASSIERDVESLISDMSRSIAEAERFLSDFSGK
jgi:hypothetical protein